MTTGKLVGEYYYMLPTMTHEFGHTLGLSDFYRDDETQLDGLTHAIMYSGPVIHSDDVKQLEAIYAYHDSASH